MNFPFYIELMNQDDIKDLGMQLNDPFETLHALNDNIHNLSDQDKCAVSFAEITVKVENLINKHLPNLIYDYCKLSFDYRNTKVIKEEKLNNQLHKYTAKHIFLSNLSKLIEEIYVLENQFNDNYIHKLLVQKRLVDQLGIQTDIIKTHANVVQQEVEIEKPNPVESFNYHNHNNSNKNVNLSNNQLESDEGASHGKSYSI